MKIFNLAALLLLAGLFFFSCSHQANKKIDAEIEKIPPMKESHSIVKKGAHEFFYSDKITKSERAKLIELHGNVYSKNQQIRDKIGRHKAILFKMLVKKDFDRQKAQLIKDRITKLYKERLELMYTALEDAALIMGHKTERMESLLAPIINYTGP